MAKTEEQDIPPVHVLEAERAQDRKETDELLAGFDKPGRAPRRRRAEQDFVAYYGKEPGAPTAEIPEPEPISVRSPHATSAERETRILPKKKRGPEWLPIAIAASGISIVIFVVALVATRDQTPAPRAAPSAVTSVVVAPPPPPPSDVPPPDPIATATTAPSVATTTAPPPTPAVKAKPHKTDLAGFAPP